MIKPQKYLNRTILFLVGVIIVCAFLFSTMRDAFATNPGLNGLIGLVLISGIIISMRQTYTLIPATQWLEGFKKADSSEPNAEAPELLGSMAKMMDEQRDKKMSISTMSMTTILDGIASRMDEGREITRYIIGLLIFLGLLGTFWGLLGTIGSIGDTIKSLQVGTGDISLMFEDLKEGLAAPLGGMGTAFSSSLFGLAGSLVLGFVDLQAGQAQNRFFNHLEDWLSGITKLTSAGSNIALGAGDASVPAYVSALLEESADSLNSLHKVISKSEESRVDVNKAITNLSIQLSSLVDHQSEMRTVMKQMVTYLASNNDSSNEVSEKHLRNIDIQLKTLTDETIKTQDKFADTMHSEIRVLARTISAAMDGSATAAKPKEQTPVAATPAPAEPVAPAEPAKPAPAAALTAAGEADYKMPEIKPKGNKKPALTAKRED